jgi:hypothetical protein
LLDGLPDASARGGVRSAGSSGRLIAAGAAALGASRVAGSEPPPQAAS